MLSLTWHVKGPLSRFDVLADVGPVYRLAADYVPVRLYLRVGQLGASRNTIVDVNLDGTSIFNPDLLKPALPPDVRDEVYQGFANDVVFKEGSVLTCDLDQSGHGAEFLTVQLDLLEEDAEPSGTGVLPRSG